MQDFIDTVMTNKGFVLWLFTVIVFTIGFALALRTETGRDALGKAAVKLAVAALGFAERWLGEQITAQRLAALDGDVQPLHPIIQAQTALQSWLGRQ